MADKEIMHIIEPSDDCDTAILKVPHTGTLEIYHRGRIGIPSYIDMNKDVIKIVQSWQHSPWKAHYDKPGNLPYIYGTRPVLDKNGMVIRKENGRILEERVPLADWIWEHFNRKLEEGETLDHLNLWRHDDRLDNLKPATTAQQNENQRQPGELPPHDPNGLTYFDTHVTQTGKGENRKLWHGASYVHNIFMGRIAPNDDIGRLMHDVTPFLFKQWSRQKIYAYFDLSGTGETNDKYEQAIQRALKILRIDQEPDWL